jgi:hypothetical protein
MFSSKKFLSSLKRKYAGERGKTFMNYVLFLWVVVQNNCFIFMIFDIKREAEQENLLLSGFYPRSLKNLV